MLNYFLIALLLLGLFALVVVLIGAISYKRDKEIWNNGISPAGWGWIFSHFDRNGAWHFVDLSGNKCEIIWTSVIKVK